MEVFVICNEVGKVQGVTTSKEKLQVYLKCHGWFWDNPNHEKWTFHFAGGRPAGFVDVFEMDIL